MIDIRIFHANLHIHGRMADGGYFRTYLVDSGKV